MWRHSLSSRRTGALSLLLTEIATEHAHLVPLDAEGEPAWLYRRALASGDVHPCAQLCTFSGVLVDNFTLGV